MQIAAILPYFLSHKATVHQKGIVSGSAMLLIVWKTITLNLTAKRYINVA